MPGGHTKFSGSWLSYHDSNGQKLSEWCKKGKDDYNGYCCLCKVDIKCNNAGKAQLLQHANFNNYCKKNCLHKVSLLYMILWWTRMAIGVLGGHLLM